MTTQSRVHRAADTDAPAGAPSREVVAAGAGG